MKARSIAALLAPVALLLAPTGAQAHVSIHPNTIPAGAFATIDVRVPGEQQGSYIKRVDTLLPAGFTSVDYEPVAGWSVKVIESKLARPIVEDGETIDTAVSQIVWTWTGPQGKVGDGQFVQFPLSVAIPANASGRPLEFRTVRDVQRRSGRALDRPLAGRRTSRAAHQRDHQGWRCRGHRRRRGRPGGRAEPAGRAPLQAARSRSRLPAAKPGGTASEGLGIAALIVGALGLLAGIAALVASRRKGAR